MKVLSTENATWRRAKKTQGIRAKPIVNLLVDRAVSSKFLVDTLEGREPIDLGNMFCIGAAGDAWQQSSKALLKKYDVRSIDADGWMVCEPRPENEVEFFELTKEKEGYVQGLWGATVEGLGERLQKFVKGDFVCRQPHDHADVWIVNRVLFNNTYSILGEK